MDKMSSFLGGLNSGISLYFRYPPTFCKMMSLLYCPFSKYFSVLGFKVLSKITDWYEDMKQEYNCDRGTFSTGEK